MLLFCESLGFINVDYIPDISPEFGIPVSINKDVYIRMKEMIWYESREYEVRINDPNNKFMINWKRLNSKNDLPNHLKMKALLLNISL